VNCRAKIALETISYSHVSFLFYTAVVSDIALKINGRAVLELKMLAFEVLLK
jgi:hypothetical protein